MQDLTNALDDPLVNKTLPRYVKVAKDELPSRFQIAKRIVFSPRGSMTEGQLWKEHARLMGKFYETKEVVDKGKLSLDDLEVPNFSLLSLKTILAKEMLAKCGLCEMGCRKNRIGGERGVCGVGDSCFISSEGIHFGEEPFISPSHTIFLMGCNFKCQFCQNWEISQWFEEGYPVTPGMLARSIEMRREKGSRNVNFVGGEPTPSTLPILETLSNCNANVPIIWNSNFYMSERTMKLLDGVVDLYLPDFKYGNNDCAKHFSKVPRYFEVISRNLLMAAKQAEVSVRHLVMPNHVECCTKPVLDWIAGNLRGCMVNLMDQYMPEFKAKLFTDMDRGVTEEEFGEAFNYAKKLNLNFFV